MAPSRATDGPPALGRVAFDRETIEGPDRPLLVLLHGAEDDPADMLAWARALDPGRRFRSFALAAPFGEATTRTWFSSTPRGPVGADVRMSLDRLAATIGELSRMPGGSGEEVVVVGYSQGGAMALLLALDRGAPPTVAVVSVCGWLPDVDGQPEPAVPRSGGAASPGRVLVVNTRDDDVVPVDFGEAATLALRADGLQAEFLAVEGTHHPGPEVLALTGEWLTRTIGGAEGTP